MKTLRKGDELVRKDDEKAEEMVKNGWSYVPKSQWKKIHGKAKRVESKVENKTEPKSKAGNKESQEAKSKYREKKGQQA